MLILFFLNLALADTVFLGKNVEPENLKLATFETLWAAKEAQTIGARPIRDDLVQRSLDFLEQRLSEVEYQKFMLHWSQSGWNQEERQILLDVLSKSSLKRPQVKDWECRLILKPDCLTDILNAEKLPSNLEDFEWLVLDGEPIPREQWSHLKISKTDHSWLFLSSKFKPVSFDGTLPELQKQSFSLANWVQGTCDSFNADPSIQNAQSRVYFSQNCSKSALPTIVEEKSFYEKYNKPIWWTIGLAVGAGLIGSMQGKKLVIQKPGFM